MGNLRLKPNIEKIGARFCLRRWSRRFFLCQFEINDRANITDNEPEVSAEIAAVLLAGAINQLDEAVQDGSLHEISHENKAQSQERNS
ncbi:MAG: type II toxin-antitoxin system RelE/ParE family toxin [Burkholderiales bacterium]